MAMATALGALTAVHAVRDAEAAPPTAPVIASPPVDGHAHSFNPRLEIHNAIDPDGDVLRYHFELFADAALTMRIGASPAEGVIEGAADTSGWIVSATPALQLGRAYCWHARARDATGEDGPWSAPGCFDVADAAPGAPAIREPADGATVRVRRPDLLVDNAVDPDGDPIDYAWELSTDVTFPAAIQWGNRVPAGLGGNTTFRLTAELADGHYCWRARGTGWQLAGPYAVGCFTVDAANDPPSVPEPIDPTEGSFSVPARPLYHWSASTDPEGSAVTYDLQVYDADNVMIWNLEHLADTLVSPDDMLTPGAHYVWRVRAVDADHVASAWCEPVPFTVDAAPLPPDDDDGTAGCCQAGASPRSPALLALAAAMLLLRRRRQRRPRTL